MKIQYIEKNFAESTLWTIKQANSIIAEYQKEGLNLTLRQLYYQFVSRDLMANKQTEYNRLGTIISQGRKTGLVDWDAIEDRTRNLKSYYYNTDPGDAVSDALRLYRLDKWDNQPCRIEVWIEKEALTGVIAGICNKLDVPYFACKGYNSDSEAHAAAMRMAQYKEWGQRPIIIHLGDHDPSGLDMTRDIGARFELFMGGLEVERIALNMDQIAQYTPPPNPAKLSDSRAKAYIKEYGNASWELDALEPKVIRDLIHGTVDSYRDWGYWEDTLEKEKAHKSILQNVANNWERL